MKKSKRTYQTGGNMYANTDIFTTGFIPTYQGEPLQEIKETQAKLDQEYQTQLDNATKLDVLLGELKSIEGDSALLNKAKSEYTKELEAIAASGDYENMATRVNALGRRYVKDKRFNAIQATKAAFDQEAAEAAKLRLKGVNALRAGDASTYQTAVVDSETREVKYIPYTSRLTAELNYDAKKKEIASQINPDSYIRGLNDKERELLKNNPMSLLATARIKGISSEKINRLKDDMLNVYLNSAEGKQEKEILQESGYTEEEALKTIGDSLESRGNLQVFSESTVDVPKVSGNTLGKGFNPTTGEAYLTLSPETLGSSLNMKEYSPHRNKILWHLGTAVSNLGNLIITDKPEDRKKFQAIIDNSLKKVNNPEFGSNVSSAIGGYVGDMLMQSFAIVSKQPDMYLKSLLENPQSLKASLREAWKTHYDPKLEAKALQGAKDLVDAGMLMLTNDETAVATIKEDWEKANPGKDFYESYVAANAAAEYTSLISSTQWSPKINNDGYREIDKTDAGKTKASKVLTDIKTSVSGLTFFDPETEEVFNHTHKRYKKDIGNIDNIKSVMGELDPRHYYSTTMPESVNTASFAAPYAITVENEDGKIKTLYVSKQASDLNSPQEQYNAVVNKVYNNFNSSPYLFRSGNIGGLDIEARFIPNDPTSNQDGKYQIRTSSGVETVNNMNELLAVIKTLQSQN